MKLNREDIEDCGFVYLHEVVGLNHREQVFTSRRQSYNLSAEFQLKDELVRGQKGDSGFIDKFVVRIQYNNGDSVAQAVFKGEIENKSQLEIGSIELRKHDLLHGIAGLRDKLTIMQKEFEEQYGTFDIDIQDGTINYPAEKPEENGEVNKED